MPILDLGYVKGPAGEPGYTPIKGVDYFDGEPGPAGKDYVLTDADKAEIAGMVEGGGTVAVDNKTIIQNPDGTISTAIGGWAEEIAGSQFMAGDVLFEHNNVEEGHVSGTAYYFYASAATVDRLVLKDIPEMFRVEISLLNTETGEWLNYTNVYSEYDPTKERYRFYISNNAPEYVEGLPRYADYEILNHRLKMLDCGTYNGGVRIIVSPNSPNQGEGGSKLEYHPIDGNYIDFNTTNLNSWLKNQKYMTDTMMHNFLNDLGYITAEDVDLTGYYTKTEIDNLLANLPTGDIPSGEEVGF